MAKKDVVYGMGQYRYTDNVKYVSTFQYQNQGGEKAAKYTIPPGSEATESQIDNYYRDVAIDLKSKLSSSKDYHLYLKIPKSIGFSHKVNVYLGQKDDGDANGKLQPIRSISVPAVANTADNVYYVAIYQKESSGEPTGSVLCKIINSTDLVYNAEGVATKLKLTSQGNQTTSFFNYGMLDKTWGVTSSSSRYVTEDMIFRPLSDDFDRIYVCLARTTDDFRIANGDGTVGHKLDIVSKSNDVTIFQYQLDELLPFLAREGGCMPQIPGNSLTRIGVWSRPGLMMAINGEEIRVGQSGYYELDAIPITSLSIYAKNFHNDNFSIDYQYEDPMVLS